MKVLSVMLLLMWQINLLNNGSGNTHFRLVDWYNAVKNRVASLEVGLSGVEFVLVGFCFVLAMIHGRRKRTNEKILRRIKHLALFSDEYSEAVYGLGRSLEDYRNRNSCMEFPLRKVAKECDKIIIENENKLKETENLYHAFSRFQDEFEQSAMIPNTEMNLDDLRLKVELAALKKFIVSEVSYIQMTQEYYSGLINDAVEEVDSVFVSDGL